MVNLNLRFRQLLIENNLDFDMFCNNFYTTYKYNFDLDLISERDNLDNYTVLNNIHMYTDLCDFFGVSLNYILGLSNNRGAFTYSTLFDQTMALAHVFFTSDDIDSKTKKDVYLALSNIFSSNYK